MKVLYYLFAVLLSLTYSVKTEAADTKKYEYDIPTLKGVYSEPKGTNIYLDINTNFSKITNAELHLEGTVEPGSVTCSKENIRTAVASEVRIVIALIDRTRDFALAGTPVATFGPLVSSFKGKESFTSMPDGYPIFWPFMKKGKDILNLRWGRAVPLPGVGCWSTVYSKVTITKAKLIIEGIKLSDSASTNNHLPKTEQTDISKPPIVDHFACSDLCPHPSEYYMEKVYKGITNEEECRKLGGRFAIYVGWGAFHICIAE